MATTIQFGTDATQKLPGLVRVFFTGPPPIRHGGSTECPHPVKLHAPNESPLTPELKGFIDRGIVPGLLRLFLAERDKKRVVAEGLDDARKPQRELAPVHHEEVR